MVGPGALGARVHLAQDLGDGLHRMLRARVFEIDANLVDRGRGLGVLLLDRGHDERRLGAGADDQRDRPLSRDVVETGQIRDASRIEDA